MPKISPKTATQRVAAAQPVTVRPGQVRPGPVPPSEPLIGTRTWLTLIIVGFAGQLAWTVENMYLNVFVYNTISTNPAVLALLVSSSAVVATVATFLVGAASDRAGRRRAFIAGGYILWGLSTAAFGFVQTSAAAAFLPGANAVVLAIIAIVLLDAVMSFFGSGANDAAFNAWVTESTAPANRGKVEGVLSILPLLSMLVIFGLLDGLTQDGHWKLFFGIIGAVTALIGVFAWFMLRDSSTLVVSGDSYLRSVIHGLRPSVMRTNPRLYWALAAWLVVGTCTQVFLPYLIIYIQRYLRIDGYAIILAVVLVSAAVLSILGGRLIDKVGKLVSVLPATAILVAGLVGMFFARGMGPVMVAGTVMMAGFMLTTAAISGLVRDYTPPERVGNVQGLRMIFAVMVPMVLGPFAGAAVIAGAAETYVDLGVVKSVPTPWIFLAAAVIAVFTVFPVLRLRRATAVAGA
ncbi:MFS transporter [Arthrobacter glacialis]|uniref:MFS transporter n=1 Tax=Arthrobacter glacialis TaxID=1664 RepID=UPI001FAF8DC2|nr:MFS transporter [Arthrobacter glacialis]